MADEELRGHLPAAAEVSPGDRIREEGSMNRFGLMTTAELFRQKERNLRDRNPFYSRIIIDREFELADLRMLYRKNSPPVALEAFRNN